MSKRTTAWWLLAQHVCARLTSPRTDVSEADLEIEAMLRASWLWSRTEVVAATLHAAWLDSWSRRAVRWAASR